MPRTVREIAIVVFLLGGGLLLLFSSSRGGDLGPVTRAVYWIMRPLQQSVARVSLGAGSIEKRYINLIGLSEENEALRKEIANLKRERSELINAESENRRLRKLLDLKSRHEFPSLVAQIIGDDALGWYRSFFINRGSDDGVLPEMPVTAAEGVVGRVVRSASDMAQVLLITDPNLSVDCRVVRTRDRGILTGSLDRNCVLRYVNLKAEIKPSDDVITSGLDGLFPRGLPVGRIQSVRKGSQGLFLEAQVTPSVNFSEIEEVIVVLGHKAGFDLQPGLEYKQ